MEEQKELSLGFIGGGLNSAIGQTHYSASMLDGLWRLDAGVFSRNGEINRRTGRARNVSEDRVYDHWSDLIAHEKNRLDAVVVLVPTPLHAEVLGPLLEAGIPVLCEKAFTSSLAEGKRLLEAYQPDSHFLSVTYNYTGYPLVRELRERIRRSELGAIRQIHLEMPQEGFIRPPDIGGRTVPPQSWRLVDGAIPTVCLDLGVHLHHLVWFLTGEEPAEVMAEFNHYSTYPGIVDDVMMWLRFESGMRGSFWFTKTAIGRRNGLKLRLFGEKGSARWYQQDAENLYMAHLDGSMATIDRGGQAIVAREGRYNRMKVGHPSGFIEAFANLYHDTACAYRQWRNTGVCKNEFVSGPEIAVRGLELFQRAADSHANGSWIHVPACGKDEKHQNRSSRETFIRQWLAEHSAMDPDAVDIDANMFQQGYIDSLAFYRILHDIETEFSIRFHEDDMLDSRIATVRGLCEVAAERQYSLQ